MRAALLPNFDPGPLDRLLLNGTRIEPPHAKQLRSVAQPELCAWCVKRSRYCVPTVELVQWLTEQINGRSAIEIGSGMGDLGRALAIQMTDSYAQTAPEMQLYYKMIGQPIVSPPPWVAKHDALEAVAKFKPRVVVAAWVTQLYREGELEGSAFGVDEDLLLSQVETYIHVGNLDVHGTKRILQRKHEAYQFPFLFSRGFDRSRNVVHVWNR